jgi:hypothetical protein
MELITICSKVMVIFCTAFTTPARIPPGLNVPEPEPKEVVEFLELPEFFRLVLFPPPELKLFEFGRVKRLKRPLSPPPLSPLGLSVVSVDKSAFKMMDLILSSLMRFTRAVVVVVVVGFFVVETLTPNLKGEIKNRIICH